MLTGAATHLQFLARTPRFTGTPEAAAAREYCTRVLSSLGYRVTERPFGYSAAVGSYGTPAGALAMLAILLVAARLSLGGDRQVTAIAVLLGGIGLLGIAGRWLARNGVLALPFARRSGVNLEATRDGDSPDTWLVAHVDSKSQPVPLAVRAGGIVVLALAWISAMALAVGGAMGHPVQRAWLVVIALAALGALPVLASIVTRRSPGAIDNASGVASVLGAAATLPASARVGVLITDAEELGLAGARAWCAGRPVGRALNCDGIDDAGQLTLMWTRPRASRLEHAVSTAALAVGESLRVIPLVPGVLVDGLAFSDAGWQSITLSRGSLATLRRIHTGRDDLDHLQGHGVERAAQTLARAALALTEQY